MEEINNQQNVEIAVLKTEVKEIRDNHLPHIIRKIDKLDTRLWWVLGVIVIGFLASITATFL